MKKIYLSLMLFAIVGVLSAQQVNRVNEATQKTEVSDISQAELQAKVKLLKEKITKRGNNSKAVKTRWYNTAFTIDAALNSSAVTSVRFIFPDTTIMQEYSNGLFPPQFHSIAECIDPMSEWFNDASQLTINKYMPYTVDSISIYGFYNRVEDVTDTLLIQVRPSTTGYSFWANNAHFTDNYSVDTCAFRVVPHDQNKTYSTDANVITIKVPLTAAIFGDTLANGMTQIKVAPSSIVNIPAGEQVIVSFGFIPGYTWNAFTDTIAKKNYFRFLSNEENGKNSYPAYTKWEWNSSYVLMSDGLYATPAESYTSHLAFLSSYSLEHHWIEVLLTANETAIYNSTANVFNVSQNHPNPFNGNTTIGYNLTKSSNVNVTIYNVAGAKVMAINQGMQSAGSHNLSINGSSLQAGVYFYTFTANNNSVTKKMIVY